MLARGGLLGLVVLAGVAAAQPPVSEWVTLEIAPFSELVRPLQSSVTTSFVASASCLLARDPGSVVISYAILDKPAWANVVVNPANDAADVSACRDGRVRFEGTLTATATDRAPAFSPRPIRVEARVDGQAGPQSATVDLPLEASYFSILDLQVAETAVILAPGASHTFVMKVTNFGNADTRASVVVTSAEGGLEVSAPNPVVVGSRQQGSATVEAELPLFVRTATREGFVNEVAVVNVRLVSSYALDESIEGDGSTASFLVTTRTGGDSSSAVDRLDVPLGWALAPFALGLASRMRARGA